MGGILVAPKDCRPFPLDGQQLAYLVEHKHMSMPEISVSDIKAMDKADGLARFVTLIQMVWFFISCVARWTEQLGFSTFEIMTLAFILCTMHTFFFWYYKPLDPQIQKIISLEVEVKELCQPTCPSTRASTLNSLGVLQDNTAGPCEAVTRS